MKSSTLFAIIAMVFFSCSSLQQRSIQYDYSYQASFNDYDSFKFIDPNDLQKGNPAADLIFKSIHDRLQAQGYKYTDTSPSLLINYKIFDTEVDFVGYQQPGMNRFINRSGDLLRLDVTEDVPNDPDFEYQYKRYKLKKGTLLISFFDIEQECTIWQGYASGVYQPNAENDRFLKWAVGKILDKYQVISNDSY